MPALLNTKELIEYLGISTTQFFRRFRRRLLEDARVQPIVAKGGRRKWWVRAQVDEALEILATGEAPRV